MLKNKVRDDLLRIGMRKADSIFEGCSMDSLYILNVSHAIVGLGAKYSRIC